MTKCSHKIKQSPITIVIGSLNCGGTERHLLRVLPELYHRGWPVEVFCIAEAGVLAKEMMFCGVPVFAPPLRCRRRQGLLRRALRVSASFLALIKHFRHTKPQLVHCFLPGAHLLGTTAAFLTGIRIRVMSRRSLNNYKKGNRIIATFEKMLLPAVSLAIGNSKAVIAQLLSEGFSKNYLRLIYNGVELPLESSSEPSQEVRTRLGASERALIFIQVANLISYKGHEDTLVALSYIRNELPSEWAIWMVGRDDGIGEALRRLSSELGLGGHVIWLGEQQNVDDFLRAADIGVLSSHQEGFSNAILEKMAASLPVVATNVGGNSEAVKDGETGFLVPPHNPRALGAALLRLANNPARQKMGSAGYKRVASKFSNRDSVTAYEECYCELLHGAKKTLKDSTR